MKMNTGKKVNKSSIASELSLIAATFVAEYSSRKSLQTFEYSCVLKLSVLLRERVTCLAT